MVWVFNRCNTNIYEVYIIYMCIEGDKGSPEYP